ncbi:MAG: hypothetical protein A2Y72_03175 [Chloroflexi bacterium RBG_13_53_26]|nr:MAG: hypothetical protein A2Y72_03175 [Chloroflexi bacterium RBG_13_53_26]
MPKAHSYAARRAASHSGKRRNKRKPGGIRSTVPGPQRVLPQKSVTSQSAASSTEPRSRVQQVVPKFDYVRSDLIRIGILTAAMLLILAILWLVL